MLAAYYSKGADSDSLFQNLEISGMDGYKENLNQYDVLFLDVAWFISISINIQNTVSEMQDRHRNFSLQGRDDVLTLLVHLWYLAYDDDSGEVYIPNEEVRQEFIRAVS